MTKITEGTKINHGRFGEGIVVKVNGNTPPLATIDFDGLTRNLLLNDEVMKQVSIISEDNEVSESDQPENVVDNEEFCASDVKFILKPSMIGQYYERHCEKYLIYNSIDDTTRSRLNWNKPVGFSQNANTRAGNEWEKLLLDRLIEDSSCLVIDLKKDENYKITLNDTIKALKTLNEKNKTIYIYQACLSVSESFKAKYLSYSDIISFSQRMYPDFIKAEYDHSKAKYCLTIIDAKNASQLKIGAEIQICIYAKILKNIIEDEQISNCFVNEEIGVVWNREKITDNCLEHVFAMQDADSEIEHFFAEKLVDICNLISSCNSYEDMNNKIDYRISQYCGYCDNYDSCLKYCIDAKSVRLLPYITVEAQDRLVQLISEECLSDDSFPSVRKLLTSNPAELTDDCKYWSIIKNNLDAYEKGIYSVFEGEKDRFPKVGSSMTFPIAQNHALYLTAQLDVISGRVYAYSWLLKPGYGIDVWNNKAIDGYVKIYESTAVSPGKGRYYGSAIARAREDAEFARVDREFVEHIYELMRLIDEYHDPKKKKLQFYVMDDYERMNIENMLFNMLETLDPVEEQDLLNKVMTIIFWMQGERMITDSDKEPEKCVENPVTVLSTDISRLYVLSEPVAYNLKRTSAIFSPNFNFDDDQSGFFDVLSNVVDGMKIIRAWEISDTSERNTKLEAIAKHLRTRLFIESNIVQTIQDDCKKSRIHLSAWPTSYKMQKPKYPDYPEIARLDFENKLEQLITYYQIRYARLGGIQNAIDNGAILWLEYAGYGSTFNLLNHENYVGREWFTAWLCEDTPENRLQMLILRDTDYLSGWKRNKPCHEIGDTGTVFYVAERGLDYNFVDYGSSATVDFKAMKDAGFSPETGKKYLLFEVYSDMNSDKTSAGIEKLLDRQDLLDPQKLSHSTGELFSEAREVCQKYWSPDGNSFSSSQEKAFIHLIEQRLNVLVGPPASGKTDFIARSLITLASYYMSKHGKKLKVMVTAMSHSAIENVMLKLDKMLKYSNPFDIKLYKVNRFDDSAAFAGKSVKLIDEYKAARYMAWDEIQIIGMTSWSAYKEFHSKKSQMKTFDMIVMDEASQVRAMDAFLNLECSDENTRFLLVGDDDQLPPIIGGKYKEKEGEKYIHGSIFRMYLTGLGEGHPDIVHLSDNFRMNGALCRYPSKAIYGPSYKAYNDAINDQTISLKNASSTDYVVSILDEEYPLVFCELSGIPRQQNEAEVKLVTKLVKELWENQLNKESQTLASSDGNFWRDSTGDDGRFLEGACGIITPHHEHINRLKTSISQDLDLNRRDIFIGTVDKLQGKERKTIIVSYGVSENEKIKSESEFIFSRNRFNVSITRGKAKTIVFLSDAIAEPNLSTNIMTANDGTLKKGIDFIHGFSSYMKKCEPDEEMISEDYPNVFGDVSLKIWKKRLIK